MKEKQTKTLQILRTKIKLCTILYRHLYNIEFMKKKFKGKTIVESQNVYATKLSSYTKAIQSHSWTLRPIYFLFLKKKIEEIRQSKAINR